MAPPSSSSSLSPLPQGLRLGRNNEYCIGPLIGEGACGTVHELFLIGSKVNSAAAATTTNRSTSTTTTDYCIKVTPLEPLQLLANNNNNNNKKITKKQRDEQKKMADILHYESIMYQNQLVSLQGTMIPSVPSLRKTGIPVTGDIQGFRFLVMERMKAGFDQVIHDIHSGKRSFAAVAIRMLDILQTIHDTAMCLVMDVKPQNFMISNDKHETIQLLDLGLVKSFATVGRTATSNSTTTGAGLVGTPLYASLHIHEGTAPPSRRDDLEALLYIFLEIILGDLPWSKAKSENEVATRKQKAMTTDIWTLVEKMTQSKTTRSALEAFFNTVHHLDTKTRPPYDKLQGLLQSCDWKQTAKKMSSRRTTVQASTPKATTPSTSENTASAITKKPPGRSTRNSQRVAANAIDPTIGFGTKRQSKDKLDNHVAKRQELQLDADDDFYSVSGDGHDDDDGFMSCAGDEMEWEAMEDNVSEQDTPADGAINHSVVVGAKKGSRAPPRDALGVNLQIISGPHHGESVSLVQGERESIAFGRCTGGGYDLRNDSLLNDLHLQLDLQVSNRKLVTVKVTDLSAQKSTTAATTLVNKRAMTSKTQKTFINDVVCIGDSAIKISPFRRQHQQDDASKDASSTTSIPSIDDSQRPNLYAMDDDKDDLTKENKGPRAHLVGGKLNTELLVDVPLVLNRHNVGINTSATITCTLTKQRKMMYILVKTKNAGKVSINGYKIRKDGGKLFSGDKLTLLGDNDEAEIHLVAKMT